MGLNITVIQGLNCCFWVGNHLKFLKFTNIQKLKRGAPEIDGPYRFPSFDLGTKKPLYFFEIALK